MAVIRQLICVLLFTFVVCEEQSKVVNTKFGKYEGSLADNGLCYKFLGIRYATPVKFRAPTPVPPFSGIYKADTATVVCPQFPTHDPLAAPSDTEDCLVLNVFTPSFLNSTLPVMVYIHGGEFGIGSGSPIFYGPEYLITHGVVVVTLNYRLNAYGFLNLGIPEAPGNAGLKDIRAALRWIQDNIAYFNGDPENVTVFGQGSGGLAAIYLTLSNSTRGLFHRVISESGSPFGTESFDRSPLNTASQVAKSLSLNTLDPYELLNVYSETSINKIEEAIEKQMNAKSVFLPSKEKVFKDEEPFLTDTPYNIISKKTKSFNPVPILTGLNIVEGLTAILDYNTITSQIFRIQNGDYSAIDHRNLIIPEDEKEDFRELIVDTYFSNTTDEEIVIGGLINLSTDFSYVGPMSLFTELYSNSSKTDMFTYVFSYVGTRNLGRMLTNSSLAATANRDELYYIFELERLSLPLDENDARMITFMTTMWTNFAKFGSPTPDTSNGEWLPYPYHLAIDLEPQYVAPLTPDRANFWRLLFYKYGVD
ncbi:juvenile hormone esterase-like [Aricia agestis]|uniref:juvenile hormone esterase-like n=1 Tax=Aricia agestis TaxID=91739 RepID=UPI001C2033DA|nr:juvenile hormone esterase-like [Aricia agestis]